MSNKDDYAMVLKASKAIQEIVSACKCNEPPEYLEMYINEILERYGYITIDEEEAYADFLNDIERVAEKHGWNVGIHDNKSGDKTFPRVELTFVPAIGYDAQFRRFGYGCEVTENDV